MSASKNFKATYFRVLTCEGIPDKTDWWAAGELIDNGHAAGHMQRSMSRANHGAVENLITFAPTLQGRMFADELAQELHRQSWRYRLVKVLIGAGSFAGGWLLGVTTEVGKAYVLPVLGL